MVVSTVKIQVPLKNRDRLTVDYVGGPHRDTGRTFWREFLKKFEESVKLPDLSLPSDWQDVAA
jgi:hypothetical protein